MNNALKDKTLLIRADGNEIIGAGHLMRCFSIAQGFMREGGKVVLLTVPGLPAIEERMINSGISIRHLCISEESESDINETLHLSEQIGPDWIILDGYHFNGSFHSELKKAGNKVLLMDDHGSLDYYAADLILNQNIYANPDMYDAKYINSNLLMGCKYSCLREEFVKWIGWKRPKSVDVKKIIITLGGADPDNMTLKIIQALKSLDDSGLHVTVIVGAGNQYIDILKESAIEVPFNVEIAINVQDMPELITSSDLAISAGGSTCWELAFLGLPSLIIVMADNQIQVAKRLEELGVAKNLGWHEDVSELDIVNATLSLIKNTDERHKMSELGQEFVDGKGTSRVIEQMCMGMSV